MIPLSSTCSADGDEFKYVDEDSQGGSRRASPINMSSKAKPGDKLQNLPHDEAAELSDNDSSVESPASATQGALTQLKYAGECSVQKHLPFDVCVNPVLAPCMHDVFVAFQGTVWTALRVIR